MASYGEGLRRLSGAIYVMFFGAGERWPVWVVVMSLFAAVYLVLLTGGFSEALTLAEVIFLIGYIAISGIGVFVRRKRRQDG